MRKDERNKQIVSALKREGTIAGAARYAVVDRGTVRRLVASHAEASDAWVVGQVALLMRRVLYHADRVRSSFRNFQQSNKRLEWARENLVRDYSKLSAEQVKEADQELVLLLDTVRLDLQKLRQCDRVHDRAIKRYTERCSGMPLCE